MHSSPAFSPPQTPVGSPEPPVSDASAYADDDALAALALWRCKGIGPVSFRRVLSQLIRPAEFLDPSLTSDVVRLLPNSAQEDLQVPKRRAKLVAAAESDWRWAQQSGRHIIFDGAADYPQALVPYSDSAPVLFVLGDGSLLRLPQLAIVGTRNPSRAGRENATRFAQALTEHGFLVISGMALGIDGCAHEGALAAGGKTVGILAHGLDRFYPKAHALLARNVLERGGALVSEFPLGVSPQKHYFPRRNRIMSALSLGVLVVEAAIKSGSLITARMALQQGKDVFAIPGSIQNAQSRGCHQLIRDGATLVETIRDITEVLVPLIQQELAMYGDGDDLPNDICLGDAPVVRQSSDASVEAAASERALESALNLLDPLERSLYQALSDVPSSIDQLVLLTGCSPEHLLTQLMVLELKDLVQTVPGGYRRTAV